jgi:hypothetical protein
MAEEMAEAGPAPVGAAAQIDAAAHLRSPAYLRLLLLAALIGVPTSAAAYFFLQRSMRSSGGCPPTCRMRWGSPLRRSGGRCRFSCSPVFSSV